MGRLVLGITGGIGAGKSMVLNILKEEYQACVIEADEVGRRLQKAGQPGFTAVVREFGEEIVGPDGELDRGKLAALVFSDAEALRKLNGLLHPMIYEEIQAEIRRADPPTQGDGTSDGIESLRQRDVKGDGVELLRQTDGKGDGAEPPRPEAENPGGQTRLIALEAAILFETGFDRCCDFTVYVHADEKTRIARLRRTRGYSEEKAAGVIANQLKDEEFRARADFVIENSGDPEETKREIYDLMTRRISGAGAKASH